MPETRECDTCSSIVKHIPAGTSKKTGKPYNDFWVCSNDNCASRQRSTTQAPKAPSEPSSYEGEVMQRLAKRLDSIDEKLEALTMFFRTQQNNKPSVDSKPKEPWDDLQLPRSQSEMPPPEDNNQ